MKEVQMVGTDKGSLRSCEQDADNWQDTAGRLDAW